MTHFTIRTLDTHDEYYRSEAAQRAIWQITDDTAVVPLHVLITAQKNGGLVACAFDSEDRVIGFVFGFLGFTASGRVKHCSHLMGVLPELRRSGVGEAIKRFQYEYVLKQGIDLITWTFDPLEGVNANLNIAKLRTVTRTYYPNLYDVMLDSLNAGIPTDRFEVEWWIRHPHVTQPDQKRPDVAALLAHGARVVNPAVFVGEALTPHPPLPQSEGESGALEVPRPAVGEGFRVRPHGTSSQFEPGQLPGTLSATLPPTVLVEVPAAYQEVKRHSMELAKGWRFHIRDVFQSLFASGYVVMDFVSVPESSVSPRRNYYILEKEPLIPDV